MGTTVKTIKAGGDYTTLQAWEDAAPANLVTDGNIWQGQASGAFTGTTNLLTMAGSTVDATHYKELTTEAGASFRDDASAQTNDFAYGANAGCTITSSVSLGDTVTISENFARLSKLQIQNTGAAYNPAAVGIGDVDGQFIDFCILQSNASHTGGRAASSAGSTPTPTLRNCLLIQRKSGASLNSRLDGTACINCTFVTSSDVTASTNCVQVSYGTAAMKNCAFFGCTAVKTGGGTITYTTCYTNATGTTGLTGGITYDTALFHKTTGAGSFRPVTGSTLLDVGTTDSTNAANDIVGTARPQGSAYDVGCWELVVAAGGIVPVLIRQYRERWS